MHAEMMKPESEGRREGKMAGSGGGKRRAESERGKSRSAGATRIWIPRQVWGEGLEEMGWMRMMMGLGRWVMALLYNVNDID